MNEKIFLALEAAEKTYIFNKNIKPENGTLKLAEHIIALNSLFEAFIEYGLAASQTPAAICELEEESYLHNTLVEPHLKVVDDIEMIAKQYSMMYVQYIAKIAQGAQSEEAVATLFA